LINRQNLYAPRSWLRTGHREAQGREPLNKGKNLPVYGFDPQCTVFPTEGASGRQKIASQILHLVKYIGFHGLGSLAGFVS
jgi:hypothetical protein